MAQSVTIPAGVVMISDTATAPSISDLDDNDLVFRVAPSDAYQGRSLAELAWEHGYRKLAVSYANDDYNSGLAGVFAAAFTELGGTITGNEAHEPNKASYRAELATLAAGGSGRARTVCLLRLERHHHPAQQPRERALRQVPRRGRDDGQLRHRADRGRQPARQHHALAARSDTEGASFQAFAAAFEAAGHSPDAPFVAHSYDISFLAALAIEKAGSADRGAISAALREVANGPGMVIRPGEWAKAKEAIAAGEDINYEGASGAIEFDGNGDVAGTYSLNVVGDDGRGRR